MQRICESIRSDTEDNAVMTFVASGRWQMIIERSVYSFEQINTAGGPDCNIKKYKNIWTYYTASIHFFNIHTAVVTMRTNFLNIQ